MFKLLVLMALASIAEGYTTSRYYRPVTSAYGYRSITTRDLLWRATSSAYGYGSPYGSGSGYYRPVTSSWRPASSAYYQPATSADYTTYDLHRTNWGNNWGRPMTSAYYGSPYGSAGGYYGGVSSSYAYQPTTTTAYMSPYGSGSGFYGSGFGSGYGSGSSSSGSGFGSGYGNVYTTSQPKTTGGQKKCGGLNNLLRAGKSMYITSPNFPSRYPRRSQCFWSFLRTFGGPSVVKIEILKMDIERNSRCSWDYLQIQKQSEDGSRKTVKKLCGTKKQTIYVKGDTYILFRSDASVQKGGFKARISVVNK